MSDGFEGFVTRKISETLYMEDGSIRELDYSKMSVRERMARAIAAIHGDPETVMASDYGRVGNRRWEIYLSHADAALDVLLEPTDDMITAGVDARTTLFERMESEGVDTEDIVVSRHPAGTIFVAMIRAAKEPA